MNKNYIKFSNVKIGQTFRFASEIEFPFSGMKKGICTKISSRKYQYADDGMICRVGSISAKVFLAS